MPDTDQKPTLENFLAGRPLNKEMEQLALEVMEEGEATESAESLASDPFDELRELDDADRKALYRLTHEPGWEVLTRIRKRTCAAAEKAATLLSQDNPLGNKEAIANGWAYLSVMRDVMRAESAAIEAEIAKVKAKTKATEQKQ